MDDLFGSDDEDLANSNGISSQSPKAPVCEVKSHPGVGGGRGVFSLQTLPAGTLVLAEVPTCQWPLDASAMNNETEWALEITKFVLANPTYHEVTKSLHPQHLKNTDPEELSTASALMDEVEVEGGVDKDEFLRVFLTLQHNGFESGLFGLLTMVNHSCDPNCIKFPPSSGTAGYSEIWTTRNVEIGEELTISYSPTSLITRRSMQKFLESHHRFHCCCRICATSTMPTINDDNEGSESERKQLDEDAVQLTIESIDRELQFLSIEAPPPSEVYVTCVSMMKTVQKIIDLFDDCKVKNSADLIKAHCYKACVNCAAKVLQSAEDASTLSGPESTAVKKPKTKTLLLAATLYLRNSLLLLDQQFQYLGQEHPDLATTFEDISQGLTCVLRFTPSHEDLVNAFPPSVYPWAASKAACREASVLYQKKSHKIRSLYRSTQVFPTHKRPRTPGSKYIHSL